MKDPIIDKILTEWSYRVHNGMPNPNNPLHLVHLKESLEYLKIDEEVIDIMMNKLNEQKFHARSKKSNRIVPFDTEDSKDAAIKAGTHEKVSPEEVEKGSFGRDYDRDDCDPCNSFRFLWDCSLFLKKTFG